MGGFQWGWIWHSLQLRLENCCLHPVLLPIATTLWTSLFVSLSLPCSFNTWLIEADGHHHSSESGGASSSETGVIHFHCFENLSKEWKFPRRRFDALLASLDRKLWLIGIKPFKEYIQNKNHLTFIGFESIYILTGLGISICLLCCVLKLLFSWGWNIWLHKNVYY